MGNTFIIFFLNLGSGEIFFIVLMMLVFFGADKLPAMARTLGKGMREMKNATAEIQREIEKGATEIQRHVNIEGEMNEVKDAADSIKKQLKEGLDNIQKHYAGEGKQGEDETPVREKENKDNPLSPPDAVKRG